MEKNAGEWTGKVEISTEEIPVSKSNMYGKGERLSSVFSPDGTLTSASAAPHGGEEKRNTEWICYCTHGQQDGWKKWKGGPGR